MSKGLSFLLREQHRQQDNAQGHAIVRAISSKDEQDQQDPQDPGYEGESRTIDGEVGADRGRAGWIAKAPFSLTPETEREP